MRCHLLYNYLDADMSADLGKKEVPLIEENEDILPLVLPMKQKNTLS